MNTERVKFNVFDQRRIDMVKKARKAHKRLHIFSSSIGGLLISVGILMSIWAFF